jgi:hypothetical protein
MNTKSFFLFFMFIVVLNNQTPDEDEVLSPIIGYPHRFYSGIPIFELT